MQKRKKNQLHPDILACMIEYGLTVKKGQNLKPAKFNLADLKFKSFLFKDEDYITGEEMRERAILRKGNLGLADAKNLLDQLNNHPDKRKDLQDKYIVLPATLLRRSDDHRLYVACLYWFGVSWGFSFRWLGDDWFDFDWFASGEPACR